MTSSRLSERPKPRILIGKPGLDGHDVGARVIARALRDAGMEVIYLGIRLSPEEIVSSAIQEDVDAIGLSILSGSHLELIGRIMELLHKNNLDKIPVIVGGIIPREDAVKLERLGVRRVFPPGSSIAEITQFVSSIVTPRPKSKLRAHGYRSGKVN